MFLGATETLQEKNRIVVKKRINRVTIAFLLAAVLPFVVFGLFYFKIISGKAAFSADIQEPVAKVVAGNETGTAFLISPTILLTARHVVEGNKVGDQVNLYFEHSKNHYQTKAIIRYIAPSTQQSVNGSVPLDYFLNDIAVLEVSSISDINPLTLGTSEGVQNLDEVILIGYPNGDYSITKGSINSDKFQGANLFKLDAVSNPGNSGGPCILKQDNTVIGILVGGSGGNVQGENIALKIDDVKRILQYRKISF